MGQRFQARQPEKAASALDGVDQAKDVIENLRVIRILLETEPADYRQYPDFRWFPSGTPANKSSMKLAFTQGARDFATPFGIWPASMQRV